MENTRLQIIQSNQPKCTHITLKGNLCGMDAIEFKEDLLQYIQQCSKNIALDLRAMKQIDLGGINMLAMAYRKVRLNGRNMKILVLKKGPLQQLLHLTKMSRLLPLEEISVA